MSRASAIRESEYYDEHETDENYLVFNQIDDNREGHGDPFEILAKKEKDQCKPIVKPMLVH